MVWFDAVDVAPKHKFPTHIQVIVSGISSGLVTTLLHPLDLVKVRLQVHSIDMPAAQMARKIMRCEGISALYNGVTAGILRQATFTTTKLAVYYGLYEKHQNKYGIIPGLKDKVVIGLLSGLVGAMAGNPSDLILVRMMADGRKDPCCPRAHPPLYKGVFHAIYKISSTEGVRALWRGGMLTLTRSACVNVIQIGSYAQTRKYIKDHHLTRIEQSARLHIYSSFISGFLTAVLTLPVDTIKTKYQIRTDTQTQSQVFLRNLKMHGILYFWRGLIPYYIRLASQTSLTYFILLEVSDSYIYIKKHPKSKE